MVSSQLVPLVNTKQNLEIYRPSHPLILPRYTASECGGCI